MKIQSRYIAVGHCHRPDQISNTLNSLGISHNFSVISDTHDNSLTECPRHLRHSQHKPQRLRSTCPWVWEEHVDVNRYPRSVFNARCICRRCIGSSARFQCEPIYSRITVLRILECHNGLFRYESDVELVTIGCTCAHRRINSWT